MSDPFRISKIRCEFVDFDVELSVLAEYLELMDSNLSRIVADGRQRVQASIKMDESDLQEAWGREQLISDGVVTRYITGAAVVACWATYESAVKMVAKEIAQTRSISLRLDDIRGGFREQSKKYFEQILHIPLHSSSADEQCIGDLYLLRNALAHANGQLDSVGDPKKLTAFIEGRDDLDAVARTVVVSLEFARYALELVSRILHELIDRVENG